MLAPTYIFPHVDHGGRDSDLKEQGEGLDGGVPEGGCRGRPPDLYPDRGGRTEEGAKGEHDARKQNDVMHEEDDAGFWEVVYARYGGLQGVPQLDHTVCGG